MSSTDFTVNPICALPGSGTTNARNLAARETLSRVGAVLAYMAAAEDEGGFGQTLILQGVITAVHHAEELLNPDLAND
ncbi:MAG: hypothetical protein IPK63_15990 [Candidatus Competibacteraceae bacterium]|nr:hypothetical protein [Candidatus Competibacteraceae bacterium]